MKLWQKNYKLNEKIAEFTTGNDYLLDQKLVKFDCIATKAHVKMLKKIGVLDGKEKNKLLTELNNILELDKSNKFKIKQDDEDCHTAIENHLTKKLGVLGKKVHTVRSRNDQVLTAQRLYEKSELEIICQLISDYQKAIKKTTKKYGKISMPGYTHMQKAMPTTVNNWLNSFHEAAKDNKKILKVVVGLIDQSPLGSAAGFGVPVFQIDNAFTAKEMGFAKHMKIPQYAQLSRGKFEISLLHSLSNMMVDINKLATDLLLFSTSEFDYVCLPKEFCTGSSIMPHKKNYDVLELLQAKYHIILGEEFKVKSLVGNMISGYSRNLQQTKEPLMKSIELTKECLIIMTLVIENLTVNKESCEKAITPELFATEEAYELVKKGTPFRQAYQEVAKKYY